MPSDDELIQRLQERAADPATRGTSPGTAFDAQVAHLDLSQLGGALGDLGAMLSRLVEDQRAGMPPDPQTAGRAEAIRGAMGALAPAGVLPPPADALRVAAAEGRIGAPLPPLLRRV